MNATITNPSIYPWQRYAWQLLCNAWQQHKLPHGIFLYGQAGSGMAAFAGHLVRYLLLADRPGYALTGPKRDREMALLRAGTHMDVKQLPEPGEARLNVEAVRQALDWVRLSSARRGQPRILVLHRTGTMNHHTANALLKTLEEPPPDVVILLLGNHLHGLPPTLISRCTRLFIGSSDTDLAWEWLEPQLSPDQKRAALALLTIHLGPLVVLEMVGEDVANRRLIHRILSDRRSGQGRSVPEEARQLQETGSVGRVFLWWRAIWLSAIRGRLTGQPEEKGLGRLADRMGLPMMIDFYATLLSHERMLEQPGASEYNLLESALLAWDELVKTG